MRWRKQLLQILSVENYKLLSTFDNQTVILIMRPVITNSSRRSRYSEVCLCVGKDRLINNIKSDQIVVVCWNWYILHHPLLPRATSQNLNRSGWWVALHIYIFHFTVHFLIFTFYFSHGLKNVGLLHNSFYSYVK